MQALIPSYFHGLLVLLSVNMPEPWLNLQIDPSSGEFLKALMKPDANEELHTAAYLRLSQP